jgi:hypothetical protein
MALRGIFPGAPFVPLERFLDLDALEAIHDEVCLALTQVAVDYTGGSHRSMDIMPSSRCDEAHTDYGEVIRGLSDGDFATFRSLSDDPSITDRDVGEEREHALSRRQMLWLKFRHKVYFPWKVYVELIPNRYWTDKATPKDFTRIAKTFFPKTIAFVKSLPFEHIGRCNVMGLEANDHGTVHRDGDPAEQGEPDHFMTFCPAGDKRLFLWDEGTRTKTPVTGRAYWFNDHDYHGVDADPFFRYSIRVDGVFRPDFLEKLRP